MTLGPLMIGIAGTSLTREEERWLRSPLIGGVILFARNFSSIPQLCELTEAIHSVRAPSLLIAVDQEGGRVQRFRDPFTRLPPMKSIGQQYDQDSGTAVRLARSIGWLMAAELRACGVDMSFAPVVELDRGIAAVIGDRAFHREPLVVEQLAAKFISGMSDAGMVATAKHFPTHAGSHADSHVEQASDSRDYPDLLDDLHPYRRLINSGLRAIMVAHVSFPCLDPQPASASAWWIDSQLRNEFGFGGAVISDDVGMVGASTEGGVAQRTLRVLEAGCDLVLLCNVADSIPEVLERLDGYSNPRAQLRLIRLRGHGGASWQMLRESERWRAAVRQIERIESPPPLHLEG